ncbi:MAG: NUDIX hydrolase [Bacteroidales bacterium]|nr:NUDIX hydrolase [Bacteroidales bacterium]
MKGTLNPYISVDCVVFGFEEGQLKVLLINRDAEEKNKDIFKLPGALIKFNEELAHSASRTLSELTGLNNIYLKQFGVFDNPKRLQVTDDLKWLHLSTGVEVNRVVTIAYYSLIKIDESKTTELSHAFNAQWFVIDVLPRLVFDHASIIAAGLQALGKELLTEPLAYELLPKKFTLNQLQQVYEAILRISIDNRNFRKKTIKLGYVQRLNEKQSGVAHKPAQLYTFNKQLFEEYKQKFNGFLI